MARKENQKLKILYLAKIFLEQTDESHPLGMAEIIKKLKEYDIDAERRSIYSDIKLLQEFGLDIIAQKGKTYMYFLAQRSFEIPEIKLLIDAVQSSHFITRKKSDELIQKIGTLTSVHQAKQFTRQVYIFERNKSSNERIYYNIDILQNAIIQNRQVKFQYVSYTYTKTQKLRRNGEYYTVSPYALTWNNGNYYLITFYEKYDSISHFRVDKMLNIIVTDVLCNGRERFNYFDLAKHTQRSFSMFSGDELFVKVLFDYSLADVVLDRFGHNITLIDNNNGYFSANLMVVPSPAFYSWIFQFGNKARIVSPMFVKNQMQEMLDSTLKTYTDST